MKDNEFDLIITDINMPNMNGNEFIENARKVCSSETPIIIVTANASKISANPDDYIYTMEKPFVLERFSKVIKLAISKKYQ